METPILAQTVNSLKPASHQEAREVVEACVRTFAAAHADACDARMRQIAAQRTLEEAWSELVEARRNMAAFL